MCCLSMICSFILEIGSGCSCIFPFSPFLYRQRGSTEKKFHLWSSVNLSALRYIQFRSSGIRTMNEYFHCEISFAAHLCETLLIRTLKTFVMFQFSERNSFDRVLYPLRGQNDVLNNSTQLIPMTDEKRTFHLSNALASSSVALAISWTQSTHKRDTDIWFRNIQGVELFFISTLLFYSWLCSVVWLMKR